MERRQRDGKRRRNQMNPMSRRKERDSRNGGESGQRKISADSQMPMFGDSSKVLRNLDVQKKGKT